MWSTRASQVGAVVGQALEDRRVLAVDRQQRRAALAARRRMNSSPPTTSASLLASSRRLPARAAARQGARPAAPTIAAITVSTSGCAASSLERAPRRAAPRSAGRRRAGARASVAAPRPRRRPRRSAAGSARHCANSSSSRRCAGQRERPRSDPGCARDDVERAGADRAGRAEDADALQRGRRGVDRRRHSITSASAIGKTGSSASMRSSTPPWPGSSLLLSLAPALRLTSDSNRSPTTLIATRKTTHERQRRA